MILEADRPSCRRRDVRIDLLVGCRSPEGRGIVNEHTVVKDRHGRRLVQCSTRRESGRREGHIVGLPLARRSGRVDQRRVLTVQRCGLTVGIGRVLMTVQDLDFEFSQHENAAVAAALTIALHLSRCRELDVQLDVRKLRPGPNQALPRLEHAVLHRPGHGSAVHHLPRTPVVARADQNDGILRRRSRARRRRSSRPHDSRLGARSIVDAPPPARLFRRVVVSNRGLLAQQTCGQHHDDRSRFDRIACSMPHESSCTQPTRPTRPTLG